MTKTRNVFALAITVLALSFAASAQDPELVTVPSLLVWDARPTAEEISTYSVFVAPTPGAVDVTSPPSFVVSHPSTSIDLESWVDGEYWVAVVAMNTVGSGPSSNLKGFILSIQGLPPLALPGMVTGLAIIPKP